MKRFLQKVMLGTVLISFSTAILCLPVFATRASAQEFEKDGVKVEVVGAQEAGKQGAGALIAGLTTGQVITGIVILGGIAGAVAAAAGKDSSSSTSYHN